MGGSSLKCGVVSTAGTIVHTFLHPLNNATTEDAIIEAIIAAIKQCADAAGGAVSGVGIGFPGIVDENVVIGGADNLPGFENLPLGKIVQQQTGYTVVMDNDANMMGVGEWAYGAAKGCTDIVFLTVGTGIGGALVLRNELYGGYKNRGTELGHIVLQQGGVPCCCGGRGCFEAYASVTALINDYKALKNDPDTTIDGKKIVEAYLQKDPSALSAMNRHFEYMATGIAGFINVFSPQKVIIGGGISEAGDFYIEEIATRVKRIAMPAAAEYTTLSAAALGNKAGLLGCAATVFRHTAGSSSGPVQATSVSK